MKQATKGALAAATAGILLTGGAGTLAYWSDSETIGGTGIDSGTLRLDPKDLDAVATGVQECTAWTLDGNTSYTAGTTLLVPGDVLTRSCSYTVEATGAHLSATLDLVQPTFATGSAATLTNELTTSAAYTLNGTEALDDKTVSSTNDGEVLKADVKVVFKNVNNLTAQGLSATLDALTVSVTQQAHPAS